MDYTSTESLTAIFTPPASCSSHWTYEGDYYNSISGGILIQEALAEYPDTECFPPNFEGSGRAPSAILLYSPGACPAGYATAGNTYNGATTTAVCCPSDFSYLVTLSDINYDSSSAEFHGCISTYRKDAGPTTVPGRADNADLTTTTVTGPLTMWAQPISVAFQQADLTLFTTSTSSSTSASPRTTSTPTSTSLPSQTASPTSTPSATQTPSSSGLSGGAIAGIVIGAAAVLGLLIGLAIFFRRKKTRASKDYTAEALPQHDKEEPAELPPTQYLGAELDGHDGHRRLQEMPADERRKHEARNSTPAELDA